VVDGWSDAFDFVPGAGGMDNVRVAKRRAIVILVAAVLLIVAAFATTGQVIVANVDGPPVSVEINGFTPVTVTVNCPGTESINLPFLRVMPRDVEVTDARNGTVLRKTTISWDTVVLIRRDGVLTGPPGGSYGPAPINGCA
jgi:hypothetical protein